MRLRVIWQCNSKALIDEMDIISGLIKKLIDENAGKPMNQSEYNERYDGYAERFGRAKNKYDSLQKPKTTRSFQTDIIELMTSSVLVMA